MYKGPHRKFKPRKTVRRQRKVTEYGHQLLEKQKLRKAYTLREKTLKNYFREASKQRVNWDITFVQLLERRLDNVIYRLGWAESRPQAAQFVNHGLILVNDKRVKISSYQVRPNDVVAIKPTKKDLHPFRNVSAKLEKYQLADWLIFLTKDKTRAQVVALPTISHFTEPINISAILQFYSR